MLLVLLGGGGGLLVALTLKYADAVVKTLATSLSIVMVSYANWSMLDGVMNHEIVIACATVIIAVVIYQQTTS